ncbi:MAG: Fe-S-cluster containining protein [Myxococcota bacterium]|jgi:Fe-S-cluster containining protein
MAHPCLECGACCATWAVQFDASEVTVALRPHVVPAATAKHCIMAGTEGDSPRCVGLRGVVGDRASCGLYPHRPSPCRDVGASLEDGHRDPTCDEARARHGLPRLQYSDWG